MTLIGNARLCYSNGVEYPVFIRNASGSFDEIEFDGVVLGRGSNKSVTHGIREVIFNDPATIVIWDDNIKTVVKCQPGDTYSKELDLAMCIAKKHFGNTGAYNEVFKRFIRESDVDKMRKDLDSFCISKSECSLCPLNNVSRCGYDVYFVNKFNGRYTMTDDEIRDAYKVAFDK